MIARRWQAPEVVQTSAMDCGPAALKCLLEGFRIPVSYGRLREACQTDVDGTSIDTLEAVAPQLGVVAEQVLVPLDHVFLPGAGALPALIVVRQADGAAHFVVLWRQLGDWLQVMDPASGRRWVRAAQFAPEVHFHEQLVPAGDWRAWAGSDDFVAPLRERLAALGVSAAVAQGLVQVALADAGWFGCAALDASVRMAQGLVAAGGLRRGGEAERLLDALVQACRREGDERYASVPVLYWSVSPDPAGAAGGPLQLHLRGAVLLRVHGRAGGAAVGGARPATQPAVPSPEIAAALREKAPHPLRHALALLREGGIAAPLALCAAIGVAAAAIVVESLLLRGLFDIGSLLALPGQRVAALAALLAFAALLLAFELPIVSQSMRHGRHLELRLRMALLAKLPRLIDRYFQSRSISDMAERAHGLQVVRQMPNLALNLLQTGAELMLTLLGLAFIAQTSLPWALAIAAVALLLPLALQPLLAERDLRLRNHAAALHGCTLDALLGAVPLRTHGAAPVMQRQQEALLVAWLKAGRRLIDAGLAADGALSLLCMGLAGALLIQHFARSGGVTGSDLLLVYWTLKLPALGGGLSGLLRQWPAQRNVLLRLLEPLSAPEAPAVAARSLPARGAAALRIEGGQVLAGGHAILRGVELDIAPGEHVAIVGASGAGKSSLLGLFLGWHRLAEGRLWVDGQDHGATAPPALRSATAWVDPGVQLWNRPLLDNLLYASDDDALGRIGPVLEAAQLRGVLQKLPQGLQTPLGEGGALLSGGEGQRVRLGRALLQGGVRLALLDEPFRGLGREQRAELLRTARRWWQDATLLCVTHDVGETLAFDRVLVVEGGRIVEDGVPAALAAAGSRYAALLQAEDEVRRLMWQGPAWRQLRVEGGRVAPAGAGEAVA